MARNINWWFWVGVCCILANPKDSKSQELTARETESVMLRAARYMVEQVSTHGGYVDRYLPDFSRRWGELEAFETQITIRHGGNATCGMGHTFLNAYQATGDEYYYQAAEKVARALIWGQLESGGWDYIIDFAGHRSLQTWYNTIGRNAWGWFEYHHYYGTATHKQVTTEAGRFLLRFYLEKMDPTYRSAVDNVINFMLESQYPLGGWPQRYPFTHSYQYEGKPDYTPFYTFSNVGVIWENIEFLIMCYRALGDARLVEPIMRGMNFYLITQQAPPQAGWAATYDLELKPTYARPFEPAALSTMQTYYHILLLMRFYQYTGDVKFLAGIPDAIAWIESTKLAKGKESSGDASRYPTFVELGTNKPLYSHRTGTGVLDGKYWVDYSEEDMYAFGVNIELDMERLKVLFKQLKGISVEEATVHSPLKQAMAPPDELDGRLRSYALNKSYYDGITDFVPDFQERRFSYLNRKPSSLEAKSVVDALDEHGRWLSTGAWVSDPYTVSDTGVPSNTALHCDPSSATAVLDTSGQKYLSTQVFVSNMQVLCAYLLQHKLELKP